MSADPGITAMAQFHEQASAADLPETLGAFAAQCAAKHGEKPLSIYFDEDRVLTYAGLDKAASKLASGLLEMGVRKGTHVAVMLPNVPEFLISWVALGRIGAVMVPANTAYGTEELTYLLTDSDTQFMVIDAGYLSVLDAMVSLPPLLSPERTLVRGTAPEGFADWHAVHNSGAEHFEAPSPVTRTDLLNLQYTSGTTGFPKGCMLTHDYWMLLGHLAAMQRGQGGQVRNTLIWAPYFYMDPQWQTLMTMALGGTAHVARRMQLGQFMDWLIDYKIEYCAFPEAALKRFQPSERDGQTCLSYINAFGWSGPANEEVERRFDVVARNTFGMTEIGSGLSVPPEAGHMAGSQSCGLPSPFREMRIVDDKGNDVPRGDIGELLVAGRSVLQSYYKKPEANAGSFTGRWFHTGDLFRQDETGYYYIVGRIKEMIKRSGENISARELEETLRRLPAIEEAAAVAEPDELRKEEVKVYLMLAEGKTHKDCPPEVVIAHCKEHLAAFKVPRYVAYVDDFPRTPTRKIAKTRIEAVHQITETWDAREVRSTDSS